MNNSRATMEIGVMPMETIMKKENGLVRLLRFKKAMRECIQNGADANEMQRIADEYGFTFAKPF